MAIKVANNNSLSAITSLPAAVSGGAMTLLETQTASSSATISFTSNIDSTYKEYQVHAINIHPEENGRVLSFQTDTGTNTNYNQTVTSTHFTTRHHEDASATALGYDTGSDLAQSTSFIPLTSGSTANNNDDNCCSILHLFDPSSTTFVKNFTSTMQNYHNADLSNQLYVGGYCNVTAAIDGVQFKMSSGNIDAGTIKMYGVN